MARNWTKLPFLLRVARRVVLVRAGTRVLGVLRTQRLLGTSNARVLEPNVPASREIATRYDSAFVTLERYGIASTCLTRSLILWSQLRRAGIDAVIRIGMQKGERERGRERGGERERERGREGGEAHAWVVVDDVVISDPPDVIERYAEFDGPLGERANG